MILKNIRRRSYNGITFGEIVEISDKKTAETYLSAGFEEVIPKKVDSTEKTTKTTKSTNKTEK